MTVLLRTMSLLSLATVSGPIVLLGQATPVDSVVIGRSVLARALADGGACRPTTPIWHKPTLTEQVGRVAVTADGRVLLHDMAMKKARLFSANGAELAQLGGEGGGPGEFGSVAAPLPWVADTVAMYDLRNSRLVLFTAQGLAREINLTTMPIFAAGGVMGRLSSGDLVLSAGLTPQDRPTSPTGKFRGIMKAVRWRPGAATVDTVRDGVRGGEWYPMMFGKQQGVVMVSFGRRTAIGTVGPEVALYDNAEPRVVLIDPVTKGQRIIRLDVVDPPVSTTDRDTLLASVLAQMKNNRPTPAIMQLMETMPKTRAAALWQGADAQGFWLTFTVPVARESATLIRFNAQGTPTHCFRPRPDTKVVAVGTDRLVTVHNDLEGDDVALERAIVFPSR